MKKFFIIGMRRSGTTILKNLIEKHSEVEEVIFEPHELFFSCSVQGMGRYRNNEYLNKVLVDFEHQKFPYKWKGAKFALNVGIEALCWRWLYLKFPDAKFIFITRNALDTYVSWRKIDSEHIRGIVDYNLYEPWNIHIVTSFNNFNKLNPKQSCIVNYEELCNNTDKELSIVWELLKLPPTEDNKKYIKER